MKTGRSANGVPQFRPSQPAGTGFPISDSLQGTPDQSWLAGVRAINATGVLRRTGSDAQFFRAVREEMKLTARPPWDLSWWEWNEPSDDHSPGGDYAVRLEVRVTPIDRVDVEARFFVRRPKDHGVVIIDHVFGWAFAPQTCAFLGWLDPASSGATGPDADAFLLRTQLVGTAMGYLHFHNVGTAPLTRSRVFRRKHQEALSHVEYRTLILRGPGGNAQTPPMDRNLKGVKQHDVKGHKRRVHLADGLVRRQWIEEYQRGDSALGAIAKRYQVDPPLPEKTDG